MKSCYTSSVSSIVFNENVWNILFPVGFRSVDEAKVNTRNYFCIQLYWE